MPSSHDPSRAGIPASTFSLLSTDARASTAAGTGTGDQGVALVLLGGVALTECCGDPTLGPLGGAGIEHVLGDQEHRGPVVVGARPQLGVDPQRGREPGALTTLTPMKILSITAGASTPSGMCARSTAL